MRQIPALYTEQNEDLRRTGSAAGEFWPLALVTVLALTVAGCTGPWTLFRHDNLRSGLSSVDTSQDKGVKRWKYTPASVTGGAAPFISSPALDFATTYVYIGSRDGGLYAVTIAGALNGASRPGPGSIRRRRWWSQDGTIYFGSDDRESVRGR